MIRFKCIYCGQRILAPDDGRGRKSKCPKCGHELVVPWQTKGRPAVSVEKTESIAARTSPPVSQSSYSEGSEQFLGIDEETIEVYEESLGFLVPAYDELSMFLMAVTWILMITVYAVKNQLLKRILHFIDETNNWIALAFSSVFILIVFIGFVLSIYHVFTTRDKTAFEKNAMLAFAVLTNILVGLIAGTYVIKQAAINNWQLVFPIWNLVNAVLLYLIVCFGVIDEDCIADRDTTGVQVILGLAAVLLLFIICHYVCKLHWAVTASVCIVYTTSFDRALQNVLPSLENKEEQG